MRLTLEINGIPMAGRSRADLFDMANMLVNTGRGVPANKWVTDLVDREAAGVIEG